MKEDTQQKGIIKKTKIGAVAFTGRPGDATQDHDLGSALRGIRLGEPHAEITAKVPTYPLTQSSWPEATK